MTRRLALALALVSACLVDVAASSWSSCGRSSRCARVRRRDEGRLSRGPLLPALDRSETVSRKLKASSPERKRRKVRSARRRVSSRPAESPARGPRARDPDRDAQRGHARDRRGDTPDGLGARLLPRVQSLVRRLENTRSAVRAIRVSRRSRRFFGTRDASRRFRRPAGRARGLVPRRVRRDAERNRPHLLRGREGEVPKQRERCERGPLWDDDASRPSRRMMMNDEKISIRRGTPRDRLNALKCVIHEAPARYTRFRAPFRTRDDSLVSFFTSPASRWP